MKIQLMALLCAMIGSGYTQDYPVYGELDTYIGWFADTAYCEYDEIKTYVSPRLMVKCPINTVTIESSSDKDLMATVSYSQSGKRIIVAFRGTVPSSISSWMTDAKIKMTPYLFFEGKPGTRRTTVHSGFYTAYRRLW